MRKVMVILVCMFAVSVMQGQTVHKVRNLKTIGFGNVRLQEVDSVYILVMRTKNSFQPTFPVVLGKRYEAIRLLKFISELKIGSRDIVDLENESHNVIKKGPVGGFMVYSEGLQFSQGLTKKQAIGFMEAIEADGR